jgi:HK97 family phage prohead protease
MKSNVEKRFFVLNSPEIREKDGENTVISGYAAKFNSRSELIMGYFYEQIAPGAFANSLVNDDIRALIDHDSSLVLGRNRSNTLKLSEDTIGLRVEIKPPDTTYARDLLVSIKRGDISGMSFAFVTEADSWDYADDQNPLRTLNKVSISDVSVVTYPAYPATEVDVRSFERFRQDTTGIGVNMAAARLRLSGAAG